MPPGPRCSPRIGRGGRKREQIVDATHVWVRDFPGKLDLRPELVQYPLVARQLRADRLQRHASAQHLVERLVHFTHASGAQEAHDLEAVEDEVAVLQQWPRS